MRCVVDADAGGGAAWTAWHRETATTSEFGQYDLASVSLHPSHRALARWGVAAQHFFGQLSGEYPIPRDAPPGEIARQLVNDLKLRVFPDQFSGFS